MTPRRILVIRLGAMGDVLHTLPAAASLKQSFPGAALSWALEERWIPLLDGNPFVDEVVPVNRRSLRAVLDLRKRLRESGFDMAVDFQGLLKSALVAVFARPASIHGYSRSAAREPLAALFYTRTCKPHSVHVVDRHLELASNAGARAVTRTFHVPEGEPEGILPERPFVLANPLAGWTGKQWPLERYGEIAKRLRAGGYDLVVNGPVPIDVSGAVSHVSGLGGLIDATRRARAVIGLDSGPLHLAAALGKPGVAMFGPTDPARNGPYGGSLKVLRPPSAHTTYKRTAMHDPAMLAITADDVWSALEPQLS